MLPREWEFNGNNSIFKFDGNFHGNPTKNDVEMGTKNHSRGSPGDVTEPFLIPVNKTTGELNWPS